MILINRKETKVKYEGIHLICFGSGRYDHDTDHCPFKANRNPKEGGEVGGVGHGSKEAGKSMGERSTPVSEGNRQVRTVDGCLASSMEILTLRYILMRDVRRLGILGALIISSLIGSMRVAWWIYNFKAPNLHG